MPFPTFHDPEPTEPSPAEWLAEAHRRLDDFARELAAFTVADAGDSWDNSDDARNRRDHARRELDDVIAVALPRRMERLAAALPDDLRRRTSARDVLADVHRPEPVPEVIEARHLRAGDRVHLVGEVCTVTAVRIIENPNEPTVAVIDTDAGTYTVRPEDWTRVTR